MPTISDIKKTKNSFNPMCRFSQLQSVGQLYRPGGRRKEFATKLALGANLAENTKLTETSLCPLCPLWLFSNPFILSNSFESLCLCALMPLWICPFSSTNVEDSLQINHFLQNKPNFQDAEIYAYSVFTMNYKNFIPPAAQKNKPKQTQFKPKTNPISKMPKMSLNIYPTIDYIKKTTIRRIQNKPNQTQFLNSFIRLPYTLKGPAMILKSLTKKPARTQKYPKNNSSLNSGLKALKFLFMNNNELTRRQFLHYTACNALALTGVAAIAAVANSKVEDLPPIRAITRGPKFHWFSYYDKLQFDPTCRYALGMEVDFEHRSPKPDDVINVGMVDLQDDDRWMELGQSRAWCWQQGCMLQWRPGSKNEIIWNDRRNNRFVCHILNVHTGKRRTLPYPIYTISPDGRTAVAPDFRRIQDMRPGYGYAGLPDPHAEDPAPEDSGIFRVNLESGKQDLIITIADIAAFGQLPGNPKDAKHYFNHLLFNTDGSRFIFLHRWRAKGQPGFGTRMLTARPDGTNIRVVDPYGKTSHFIWRDTVHILAWAWHPSHGNAFYLYPCCCRGRLVPAEAGNGTERVEVVGKGVMTKNGHCTYLPGNKWILNDTYPDKEQKQNVYLYNVATGKKVPLGHFYLPPEYKGEWRCDTHPRFSPDGRSVVIDSAHGGNGRQMYLIDISAIVG